MKFELEQQLDAPVEQVESVLVDPAFIAASARLPKVGGAELLEQQRDGTTVRQRIRYRFTAELSSAVTAVVDPDKLTWVDDATYDLAAHRSTHRIVPDHYGNRLQASYEERFEPAADGRSVRRARGDVRVRMPLVGGRVERAIVSGLEEHAEAERALLSEWLDRADG